jgi:hypothetical protein
VGQFEAANGVLGTSKLLENAVVSKMNDGSLSCSNKTGTTNTLSFSLAAIVLIPAGILASLEKRITIC